MTGVTKVEEVEDGGEDGDNGAAAGISPFNSQTLKTADRDLIGRRKWRKPGKL